MCFKEWMEKGVKKMDWMDIGLTKASVFLLTLLLAKHWPALYSLDWYWYLGLALIAAARPMHKFFSK